MAFPTISAADTQSGVQSANATTWTLTYPTNLATGDLILAFMARDGSQSSGTWPSGWLPAANGAGACSTTIAAKKSDGTETGSFNVTSLSSEQGCWRVIRITAATWQGTLTDLSSGAVINTGTGTVAASLNPNPASLNPSPWDAEDTLWIAMSCSDHGDTTYTGFPANYTQHDHTTSGGHAQESGGAGGASLGIAFRRLNAASEDPGTFTVDASEEYACQTIAVRPAAAPAYKPRPPGFQPFLAQ